MKGNKLQNIAFCLTDDEFKKAVTSSVDGAKRIFLVHGHKSYQACGAKALFDRLAVSLGWDVVEFEDFSENPKKEDVDHGVGLVLQCKPDVIVAVGGGSVLDMAKLVRHFSEISCKLLALPTTAGTGAESTQFAVCYINGVKHSISDASILPDDVILYPPFTYGNGRYLTACTGFDALAQAIEAYWNINSTAESDKYALRAIKCLFPLLTKEKLENVDRDSLLRAANDAGRAINITRTTVPHALSYTLTSKYGYPHGHAVALTFPFFLQYNLEGSEDSYKGKDFNEYAAKMARLRSLLGVDDDSFTAMRKYIDQLGLGFDPNRDYDDLVVAKGLNLERAKNTPIAISNEVVMEAVKSIRIT